MPKMTKKVEAPVVENKPQVSIIEVDLEKAKINKIAKSLQALAVPIDSLVLDPENARLHPEKNLVSIKESLVTYGQLKPVVVRKSNKVVVAGNGTVQAARELGWTQIAATIVDMNDVQATGYGLADNRTAELAKWDFEVVARLDKILLDSSHPSIGWSKDDLEVLRLADWTPPPIKEEPITSANGTTEGSSVGSGSPPPPGSAEVIEGKIVIGFTQAQWDETISAALTIGKMRHELPEETDPSDVICMLIDEFLQILNESEQ